MANLSDFEKLLPGIDSRPEVCGGDACIVQTRIPVWLLEQALLAACPSLRAEDLVNAGLRAVARSGD